MSKALEKKKQMVAEIAEKLKNSKSTILTDYRGLTVAEMNELRKQLREAGVEYKVLKNTLTRRATAETGLSELDQHLTGPTAIAFSAEDVVAPAKILYKFSKDHEALEIKGGVVEGRWSASTRSRNWRICRPARDFCPCCLACCRRRSATSPWPSKRSPTKRAERPRPRKRELPTPAVRQIPSGPAADTRILTLG